MRSTTQFFFCSVPWKRGYIAASGICALDTASFVDYAAQTRLIDHVWHRPWEETWDAGPAAVPTQPLGSSLSASSGARTASRFTFRSLNCVRIFVLSDIWTAFVWVTNNQWLKFKIRGGTTAHSDLGRLSVVSYDFPYHCNNLRWGTFWVINWRRGNGISLHPITL